MTQARIRVEPELAQLSRSQWERLIYEANLGTEDSDIARRYFIDKQCQIDIAIDKDMDRKAVSRRVNNAQKRISAIYRHIPS